MLRRPNLSFGWTLGWLLVAWGGLSSDCWATGFATAIFPEELQAATPIPITVIDFNAMAVGGMLTPGASLPGVSLTHILEDGVQLAIQSDASGDGRVLGTTRAGGHFLPGESITFHFASPVIGFGLTVNAANAVTSFALGTYESTPLEITRFPSRSPSLFLGFYLYPEEQPISSAILTSAGGDAFFTLDDLMIAHAVTAVPEPSSIGLMLLLGTFLAIGGYHRRRLIAGRIKRVKLTG